MVHDRQVRILMDCLNKGYSLKLSSAKAGMSEKTARKYRDCGKLPSEVKIDHHWRTRQDPFRGIWDSEVKPLLKGNPSLEGKTIFDYLQREYPGRFQEGQLRTLQRRIKEWRAIEGPAREVYFCQVHHPGELCASDFTHMDFLGITIGGVSFPHLLYHFVLTYSNWETGTICYSESFENLSTGFQNALWELGGVPLRHRTDGLRAAVQKPKHPEEFTRRYQGLLDHYGIKGEKIQPGKANENGDVEQSHRRFKDAVEQALMLRGSRNFADEAEYVKFIRGLFRQRNSSRMKRFREELDKLRTLPQTRLLDHTEFEVRVNSFSLIRVAKNSYSVDSRLIGEKVKVRLYADHLEIWYGSKLLEKLPRIKGKGKHQVNYRHIIDWLVRKPGAFENYRYKKDLFPSTYFRVAYDALRSRNTKETANKEYLAILYLAATKSEQLVEEALRYMFKKETSISAEGVEAYIATATKTPHYRQCKVNAVNIRAYDRLLSAYGGCL